MNLHRRNDDVTPLADSEAPASGSGTTLIKLVTNSQSADPESLAVMLTAHGVAHHGDDRHRGAGLDLPVANARSFAWNRKVEELEDAERWRSQG